MCNDDIAFCLLRAVNPAKDVVAKAKNHITYEESFQRSGPS